ncbi:alpha/beta hydrolase [Streptomyces sp. NPDC002793]|uniref:alpha/beta fold hydrolase n=1 Tax=Streptomyces sp. NPDC002793 TaxID=3154432 RepID=UPI00332871B6
MSIGEFRNVKARERFHAVYGRLLDQLWSAPRDTIDLPTSFGTTRVHRAGPPGPDPVVLLPGANGNSLMWHRYIAPLARHRTVIAVDTVGEPGASVQRAPLTGAEDGARWLEEVLAGTEATAAHLVGCSYGGWLALGHQIHRPGRTAALTLLEPAGFADPGRRFYAWLIAGGLAGTAPRPLRPWLARRVGNSAILETELMELGRASIGFRRALPPARVFSDEELRRVRVPSLFLLGERSALHDPRQVAGRVRALVPAADVEIVPAATHALPTDDPELMVARILRGAVV